jgi:DNA-binding MarR family transcriptional regulator
VVEKGLLERNRDQEDWRAVHITFSPQGEAFLREMQERRAEAIEAMLSGRSEAELATLQAALKVLEAVFDHT